jgi:hypothetical protein
MKNLIIWQTYHDDVQIEQYHLHETDTIRLFKGNNLSVEGENINHLNKFYSELVTLYWVWKNNVRSKMVGFCHYRRIFGRTIDLEDKSCQVLTVSHFNVMGHYKSAHNYQDFYDAIDILNEQFGKNNKYSQYMLRSNVFIPFCSFIMHWEDFTRLCSFVFSVLFAFDDLHQLDMSPQHYMEKAQKDFRYDNVDYQCRAMSFLGERLISCWLFCEMKIYCLHTI